MNATAVLYRIFPDFRELKQRTDDLLRTSRQIYEKGWSLHQYITENKSKIVNRIGESFQQTASAVINELENRVKDTWKAFKQDFNAKQNKQNNPPSENQKNQTIDQTTAEVSGAQKNNSSATPHAAPPVSPVPVLPVISSVKPDDLTGLVDDFKEKLSRYGSFNITIDGCTLSGEHKEYAIKNNVGKPSPVGLVNKTQNYDGIKPGLEYVLNNDKYCGLSGFAKTSAMITDLYNSGYRTKEIKREMKLHNIFGVNNYDDVLERLAFSISNGSSYSRDSYNFRLAEKLGANEQIIKSYESGKSFSEIKSEFGSRTGGMSISYSSYRRLLRKNNACRLNSLIINEH